MEDEITRLTRKLGSCPSCGAEWKVVTDKDGNVGIQGNRPPTEEEMRRYLPGTVRVCATCGNGIDANGRLITRQP